MRIIFSLFCLVCATMVSAQTRIEINRGTVEPLRLAMPAANLHAPGLDGLAGDFMAVIAGDLQSSNLFAFVSPAAFLEPLASVETVPTFASWRKINSEAVLVTDMNLGEEGVVVDFRLWDAVSEKQYGGKSFTFPAENWRRAAHLMADEVYSRLTGEQGYFDSRILYVAESGHWKAPKKRLAIMDQDGANHRYLTNGEHLVLTPRFDPARQRVVYLGYYGGKPGIYLYDLIAGTERKLGQFEAMNFAPRFSPDGRTLLMSMSKDGNTEIYRMNVESSALTRITHHSAIDTSPSFSPDSKHIVFSSDRGGSQQLYVMQGDGSGVKRISFGKGSYSTPLWSPRGDLIAFTRYYSGQFYIGVMRPDGSGERMLSQGFLVEGPSWSPNGRVLIYTKGGKSTETKQGDSSLYMIDVSGLHERRVTTPGRASDPAWSPLLSVE